MIVWDVNSKKYNEVAFTDATSFGVIIPSTLPCATTRKIKNGFYIR